MPKMESFVETTRILSDSMLLSDVPLLPFTRIPSILVIVQRYIDIFTASVLGLGS